MLASILILVVSLALFLYWFRYSCLFLLRRQTISPAAADPRFSVAEVERRLRTESDLDPLHRTLDREYRIVTYLIEHAATFGEQSIEDRLLMLDYAVMRGWYRVTRNAAPRQARKALSERAAILGCLSRKIGEQAGLSLEA